MGREARCMAEFGGWQGMGRLLLETDDLIFRGAARLSVRLADITRVDAANGWLIVEHGGGSARFDLGQAAPRWAHAILHPKTRIEKLDVKIDARVAIVDISDAGFLSELRARTPRVEDVAAGDLDIVFYGCERPEGLSRLAELARRIAPNGAIWLITPRGRPELGHAPIVAAAKAAALVDTKTARFSDTHTALKLVIPRAARTSVQTSRHRPSSQE